MNNTLLKTAKEEGKGTTTEKVEKEQKKNRKLQRASNTIQALWAMKHEVYKSASP